MLTLAINTASSVTGIALINSEQVLAENSWPSHNNEAEKLMPQIDALLKKCGHKFDDLEAVLAISGPGSFTGLRIGVTTANTIAHLLGCQLFAVNTFDYWHAQARAQRVLTTNPPSATVPKRGVHVLVFAGKGGVYLSIAGSEPRQLTLAELPQVLHSEDISEVCGDISEDQIALLIENGIVFHPLTLTFGQVCLKLLSGHLSSLTAIVPLYVKEPAITLSQK